MSTELMSHWRQGVSESLNEALRTQLTDGSHHLSDKGGGGAGGGGGSEALASSSLEFDGQGLQRQSGGDESKPFSVGMVQVSLQSSGVQQWYIPNSSAVVAQLLNMSISAV